jgi:mgtE-like transporter
MKVRSAIKISLEESYQLVQSFARFKRSLKQSFFGLSFIIGSLFAGLILVKFSDLFSSTQWIFIIYPTILSMRGVIGGVFSGRLTTGLHLGTIKASLTENTRIFYMLLSATITLTLQGSLMIGGFVAIISGFFWMAPIEDILSIVIILISTMNVSIILVSPLTLFVSFFSFRYGLDPDSIVYPAMSTIADIIDTLCFILMLKLFSVGFLGLFFLILIDLTFIFIVIYFLLKYRNEVEYLGIIKELFPTMIVVTFIVNITGNILGKINQFIGNRPDIYFIYPSIISTVGATGSIIGSTITTKLALGTAKATISELKHNVPEISGTVISSVILFILFSFISSIVVHGSFISDKFLPLVFLMMVLNILAVPLMSIVAYVIAILTYKKGLNPDNFVIPFESSLSDSITTIFLLFVLTLFSGIF